MRGQGPVGGSYENVHPAGINDDMMAGVRGALRSLNSCGSRVSSRHPEGASTLWHVYRQMFPTARNASSRSGKLGIFASRRIRCGVFMESPPIMQPTIIFFVCLEKRISSFATRMGLAIAVGTAITNAMSQRSGTDHHIERFCVVLGVGIADHVDRVSRLQFAGSTASSSRVSASGNSPSLIPNRSA